MNSPTSMSVNINIPVSTIHSIAKEVSVPTNSATCNVDSPAIITNVPPPNLWEKVCQEFQQEREQFELQYEPSTFVVHEFDPSKHHPAFFGKPFAQVSSDFAVKTELDPSVGHPSCASYWISEEDASAVSRIEPRPAPDKKLSSNREFLEYYVWPTLLPALEKMLVDAKRQGCFGLKKVSFNSLDYLTEYLHNHNPLYHPADGSQSLRQKLSLFDIPFVQSWLSTHPRPPQPVSLTWTEDETASKIQAAWRGYLARREPEVQELRKWQQEWRTINLEGGIQEEVSGFWDRVMPDSSPSTTSTENSAGSSPVPQTNATKGQKSAKRSSQRRARNSRNSIGRSGGVRNSLTSL